MTKTKKKQRKTAKKSKPEFTVKTRVYDLVKSVFHNELKQLSEDIKEFVLEGSTIDWKHLRRFDFDKMKIKKAEFVHIIAGFLFRIGKDEGLKSGNMSVFIRYLASNEHSNFGLKPNSLNTLIHRMFDYLESKEKDTQNL